MEHAHLHHTGGGNPVVAFIQNYDHQIGLVLIVLAMMWHVATYRREMFAVFRRG